MARLDVAIRRRQQPSLDPSSHRQLPKSVAHGLIAATAANALVAVFAGIAGLGDDRADALRLFGFALIMIGMLLLVRSVAPPAAGFQRREAMATVTIEWVFLILFGTAPYLLSGVSPNVFDALYESTAGYTTTSSTTIVDVSAVSDAMHFWRAGTQWMGAFTALIMAVVIFPRVGLGDHGVGPDTVTRRGRELGSSPGQAIRRIAIALGFLSVVLTVLYVAAGMSLRDGLFHGLTTSSTGGFSTRNGSIAAFDSAAIEWVAILGMVAAGASVVHVIRIARGAIRSVWRSYELRAYLGLLAVGTLVSWWSSGSTTGLRGSLFGTASAISTTGLRASNWALWEPVGIIALFALMTIGAMGGSPGGGLRVVSFASLFAAVRLELQRNLYPRMVAVTKLGRVAVPDASIGQVAGQIFLTITVVMAAVVGVTTFGAGMLDGLTAVVSAFANAGPAVGAVAPDTGAGNVVSSFDNALVYSPEARMVLAATMFVGRLAVHPVLVSIGIASHAARSQLRWIVRGKAKRWQKH